MPVGKLTATERKQEIKPQITPSIIAKMKYKDKLNKKFIKSKNMEIKTQVNKIKTEITPLTGRNRVKYCKYTFQAWQLLPK